jgi:hypothetical protein
MVGRAHECWRRARVGDRVKQGRAQWGGGGVWPVGR